MSQSIPFPYYVCKKISTKQDEVDGIKIYAGQAPISSFIELPDDENVRRYTVEANKRSKRPTDVHNAIRDTLTDNPNIFPLLNNGITLVTRGATFSAKSNVLSLENPSIINGSQTRGVIKEVLKNNPEKGSINVKYEIIETTDIDLISDISIARNMQIRVEKISIMGRQGIFDELEEAIKKTIPSSNLKKSETDRREDYLPTERILQVIASIIPKELWENTGNKDYSKAPYYSRQSKALNLFKNIFENRHDPQKSKLYKFYLDIACDALKLYEKWSKHSGFKGCGLKNGIERDKNQEIIRVYDGLIFPIIAAHAILVSFDEEKKQWKLAYEQEEKIDKFLIEQAKRIFQEIANSKAEVMGKTQACYSQLYSLMEAINNNPLQG